MKSTHTALESFVMKMYNPYNLQVAKRSFERGYVQNILMLALGDEEKAARMLGIPPTTLRTKLEQYNAPELEIPGYFPEHSMTE